MPCKKLCKDAVRDALRAVGRWPMPRNPSPHDFTEEERFRMFRAVMHGHVWPVSDIIRYEGRLAFSWTYSVWSRRHGGRGRFAKRIREAAAAPLTQLERRSSTSLFGAVLLVAVVEGGAVPG